MNETLRLIPIICLLLFSQSSQSQNLHQMGQGLQSQPYAMCWDSANNQLYVGGAKVNTCQGDCDCIVRWDGNTWTNTGTGTVICSNPTNAMAMYQGQLHAEGHLQAGGSPSQLGRLNNGNWEVIRELGLGSAVGGMRNIGDQLYLAGHFLNPEDTTGSLLMTYNGIDFKVLDTTSSFHQYFAWDVVQYREDIYVGGFIHFDSLWTGLGKLNGSSFEQVGGYSCGAKGDVRTMAVFQDELYVGGKDGSVDGSSEGFDGIARWDGQSWHPVEYGLHGTVNKLLADDTLLLALGDFSVGGNPEMQNVAAWDGVRWCDYDLPADLPITTGTLYGDDLILGLGFNRAYDTFNHIVQLDNYRQVAGCHFLSIQKEQEPQELHAYPNPTSGTIHVELPSIWDGVTRLSLISTTGKLVLQEAYSQRSGAISMDIAALPAGLYLLQVEHGGTYYQQKIMKQQ